MSLIEEVEELLVEWTLKPAVNENVDKNVVEIRAGLSEAGYIYAIEEKEILAILAENEEESEVAVELSDFDDSESSTTEA